MIPRILIVSDNSDARSKGLAEEPAPARRGRGDRTAGRDRFRHRPPDRAGDTGFWAETAGRRARPLDRGRIVRGGHAASRRAPCAWPAFRAGVEFRAGDRALRRQVDDDVPAQECRPADAADIRRRGTAAAEEIAARELTLTPLVLKPLFGAQGRGIRLIRALADLPPAEEVNDVYYLQHYVPRAGPPFRDFRVFVCAGKAVAMMSRRGDGLDHQRQPRRGAGEDFGARRSRTGGAGGRRGGCGRRGFRRRRHRAAPATAACSCSRSTACRPGRGCNRSSP